MYKPKSFTRDLQKRYKNEISFTQLVNRQEEYLRSLAAHSLRYRTDWCVSDLDDMYQETLIWMNTSMWEWRESKGVPLDTYVLYNIGARLKNQVMSEKCQKRHPKRGYKKDIWGDTSNEISAQYESTIPGPYATPETQYAIKEALEKADKHLSDLAKDLIDVLLNKESSIRGAARELIGREDIKKRFGSPDYLKHRLSKYTMKEISSILDPVHIIPSEPDVYNG